MEIVLICAFGVGGATALGAILGFIFKNITHRFSDIVIAFTGGTVIYVISDELIPTRTELKTEPPMPYPQASALCRYSTSIYNRSLL